MALDLNLNPYYDDYDELKNYFRVLYNPSKAVQARELTQAQTILHNQLSKHASHIFNDGAPVLGADVKVNSDKVSVLVNALADDNTTPIDISGWVGFTLYKVDGGDANTGDTALVTHVDQNTRMMLIDYKGGDFLPGDKLVIRDELNAIISDVVVSTDGIQYATTSTITAGLVYVYGTFVQLDEQNIVVDWLDNTGHYHIGVQMVDTVVTSSDDGTLVDPANGSYNFGAPGADRYKIVLNLVSYVDGDAVPTDFYSMTEVVGDNIIYATKNASYGAIIDLLAQRTYDESGDYVVEPFEVFVTDDPLDNSNYQVKLDAGLAYIKGYEVSTQAPTYLTAPKPRVTRLSNNELVYADYGIYIDIDDTAGDDLDKLFNVAARESVNLLAEVDGAGRVIATTRILSISRSPTNKLRVWLEWIPSLRDILVSTKSIVGISSTAVANNIAFDAVGQSDNVSLVYTMDNSSVKDFVLNETILTSTKSFHGVIKDGSGDFILLADDNTSDFVSSGQGGLIVVLDDTGTPSTEYTYVTNSVVDGLSTLVITPSGGLIASATVSVVAQIQRPTANPKTKTLTANVYTFNSSGTTQNFPHFDLFRITQVEVKDVGALDTTYVDVTDYVYTNNNTDIAYEYGTLSNITDVKTYRVSYDYFAHSGTGDFFAINSYTIAGNLVIEPDLYALLGDYESTDGNIVSALNDVVDFRRTTDDLTAGVWTPSPRSNMFVDYNHHLARLDKVVVSKEGVFSIIQGVPSELPEPADTGSSGVVTLYDLALTPYTKVPQSIITSEVRLSNFTMKDIHNLSDRVDKLQYYNSLTLLEKQSSELSFVDEAGLNKFKNGIMVDNFSTFDNSLTTSENFRSTIDPTQGVVRSPFVSDSTDFTLDALPAGLVEVDGQIMFAYTSTVMTEQLFASGVTNLMPYDIVRWTGSLKIVPSSDNWIDNVELPIIRTTQDLRDSVKTQNQKAIPVWGAWETQSVGTRAATTGWGWNGWGWNGGSGNWGGGSSFWGWGGRRVTTTTTTTNQTRSGTILVPQDITATLTEDRVISRTEIPYMRAKTIAYTAEALRPHTEHSVVFDDVNVDAYCDNFLSDASGNLAGTFNLPAGTFATGSKVIKVVDSAHGLNPLSEAGATYTARGTLVKNQRTITTLRQTVYSTRNVSDSRALNSTARTSQHRWWGGGWWDPVAQSFRVDDQEGGAFLSSIDIYFNSKSEDIPVQIYLVEMENGLPSSSIIPGSQVTLQPASVNLTNDGATATNFTFDAPIHLQNETDYAFIAMSNSKDYNIFHAELGETDLVTGKRIVEQPYLGSMFLSQNAQTWTPAQTKDVKFKLNKCVFGTGTETIAATNDNTILLADAYVSTMLPNFELIDHDGALSEIEYKFYDEAVYTKTSNKVTIETSNRKTLTADGINDLKYNINLTNTNPNVTPIMDTERLSSIIVYNDVIDIVNPTTEETSGGFKDAGTYITKTVGLTDAADDIRVMFDAKLPGSSRAKISYKASTYIPKYVETKAGATLHAQFKNSTCYVYWYNSADGSWTEKSTVFVTQNDSDSSPNRVYISKVGDYTDFIDDTDFASNSITDIFLSDHNIDDTILNIGDWLIGSTYAIGDYVFDGGLLYVSNISSNTGNTPTDAGTAWELIETTSVESIIVDDPESGWKLMKQENVVDSSINTSNQFIEYTFIPDEYPEDEFKEFSIKVEMQSTDFTNIPLIQNFRAIALM